MSKKDHAGELLRQYQPFMDLPADELRTLDHLAYVTRARPGQSVVSEGRLGQQFVILMDGEAEVRRGDELVATLRAGDCFGEMSILEKQPTNASVVVTTDSVIAAFGVREFDEMIRTAPGLVRKLLVQLSNRLRTASAT